MINLITYKLLKKSFYVRKLFDIFYYSPFVIILHFDRINSFIFSDIRKKLEKKGVFIHLLNKDNFLNLRLGIVSKGSSVLFYSNIYFFYFDLENEFTNNKMSFDVVYFKYYNSLVGFFKNLLLLKYNFSKEKLYGFFFFVISFYKNIFLFYNFLIKKYLFDFINLFLSSFLFLFNFFLIVLKKTNKVKYFNA
jgi:hypothetical protein